MQPFFSWLLTKAIKKKFKLTTQHACTPASTVLHKHYEAPFPALKSHCQDEPVATDAVYCNTPAINDGAASAQIFVGTRTFLTDVYGMKSDEQFVATLSDNIRQRGAMSKLISDRAQVEISNKVKEVLCALFIDDWKSKACHQHQNKDENRYNTVK